MQSRDYNPLVLEEVTTGDNKRIELFDMRVSE